MKKTLQYIAITAVLALSPHGAKADEVILFKCYYDWMCDPNRKCVDADMHVNIRHNADTNEAEIKGAGGSPLDQIGVHIGDRSVSFLAYQISGAVDVTTVALRDGESVHTTHRIDGITLNPLQYLGECTALPASQ